MNPGPPQLPTSIPKKSGMPTWALVLIIAGGVGLLMILVIGLLAAIAIPNFVRAREAAQRSMCINNLRIIDGAKQAWALESKKESADTPTPAEIGLYMKDSFEARKCPNGGVYSINSVGEKPTCSIPGHELPEAGRYFR